MLRHGLLSPPPLPLAAGGGSATRETITWGKPSNSYFGLTAPTAGGVTVTAGAGTAKGTAQTFGTLAASVDGLELRMVTTTSRSFLVDVYRDAVKIVDNLPLYLSGGYVAKVRLPIRILTGGEIKIAIAASSGSSTASFEVRAWQSDIAETITSWVALGAATPGSGVATLNLAAPAWETIGTLAADAKAILPCIGTNGDVTRTQVNTAVEVATGAAPSETSLYGPMLTQTRTNDMFEAFLGVYRETFANGTRFTMKATPQTGTPADTYNANILVAY